MKKLISLAIFLLLISTTYAQQIVYNIPTSVTTDQVSFVFEKVKSATSSYYINYKAKNTGDGYLIINRENTSLLQNGGELHPTKTQYILKPGESKTIYNQFRVKPPAKAHAEQFDFQMSGISYAMVPGTTLKADKLVLAEKAEQTIGDFKMKVMEYNVHSDRTYAQVKCTYNGTQNKIGKIDLTKIKVNGGNAEIVKKGDIIFPGKSYTFAMNVTPSGDELSIDWSGVIQVLNLADIKIETINIRSTTFKEEEAAVKTTDEQKETNKPATEPTEPCELSYSDFTTLKNDIETEMNAGGKPVEMAHEYLMAKGCISTAQVVELMSVFNLDGSRLEFAKMAYKYASDKVKYHMAVAKLSYVKNKEALENFLGQQ